MRSSIVLDQAASSSCRSFSWPRHYGGLSMLVAISILFCRPDLAFAQYPGFSSDAEPGSVSAKADDAQSDGNSNAPNAATGNDESANSLASSSALGGAGNTAIGNLSGGDHNNSDAASNGFGVAANHGKARQSRQSYFVRKLRIEFATMELVERRSGMAFSRHNVPRYLDELRAELAKIRGPASASVKSLAHDIHHIDSELNKHIDKLLAIIGTPTTGAPSSADGFFKPHSPLLKTSEAAAAKMSSISLKYELMDYGEKALQAMGVGYR